MPLARIASPACRQASAVHLPRVAHWDLPVTRHDAALQEAIAQEQADIEARHVSAWQRTQTAGDGAAAHDRITHYHCDHLGTPRELTDAQGNVVWSGRYKAWGRLLHVEGEIDQPLRFQGQYEDGETGLFYNRYRYYDPDVGRYLSQDPIGLTGGLNGYAYATNPIQWSDPLGLAKCKIVISSAADEIRNLPALNNMLPSEIRKILRNRGYTMVGSRNNASGSNRAGQVWTKSLPDGNTAAVRIDPAESRSPPLGRADEVPHAHKEIVPTSSVSSGNYGPPRISGSTLCDDTGNMAMPNDFKGMHIEIKKGVLK